MKLKFKIQPYQTQAVQSIVDCFSGQPKSPGIAYRIDPGKDQQYHKRSDQTDLAGFKNQEIQLSDAQLLSNIQAIQKSQNLSPSTKLTSSAGCKVNLDVEMETGTGKTYCYIKTMFEMNKRFGWSKFIIVVPSIAIREGVYKSLEITSEHFAESYGKKTRFFIYNSKQLHNLESFSSDAGINVMVINVQAFNATGKDNRRIYEELDDFQSRRPIDVIKCNRPILILDEPQKMEGKKTLDALSKFNPLMILRYSATHRKEHNKVHRLDAVDAYNEKLVKKIKVRGISVKGLAGTNAYLYLESIEISKAAPVARLEMEVRQKSGIKRMVKRLRVGQDLFTESNELDQYKGFIVSQIDAGQDRVEFSNGYILSSGDAIGNVNEAHMRRIQIREAIKAHLDKEQELFQQKIKVLSLFFIDEVAKYRDYSQDDEKGEYARIFEEEYQQLINEYLSELPIDNSAYREYLNSIPLAKTHNGYFSIDKKTNHFVDPKIKSRGEEAGLSDDTDAYDLILKDKERLLSIEEPVRFIFSHSALREGWDNPNVFVICMLKQSNSTISRRQEVGRGLRIAVNQQGDRMDHPATVHEINTLTVVASESYKDFVKNLQQEISDTLSTRPRKANEAYFTGKCISTDQGPIEITPAMSKEIYRYLLKNDYVDQEDSISETYLTDRANNSLSAFPSDLTPYQEGILELVDNVFNETQLPEVGDDRRPKRNSLNANFHKKEFRELWNRINYKAVYRVEFDSAELIQKSILSLNSSLKVSPLRYTIQMGEQNRTTSYDELKSGAGFEVRETASEYGLSAQSTVKYDLLGKISTNTNLTRKTLSAILMGIHTSVFDQFKINPEHFIEEVSRLINEQKATTVVEQLTYDTTNERHDMEIFTTAQTKQDFSNGYEKLQKHIYDYVVTDANVEREFVKELDTSAEVVVYAKLPRGFQIPTPVGDYCPDWAIAFKDGAVKHIYFVAETKGSMSSLQLRAMEETKIACARKFFEKINHKIDSEHVRYDVVTCYEKLMDVIR